MRLRGTAFWQTLVFVLEALVFILIGFSLRGVLARVGGVGGARDRWRCRSSAVIAVVVARFVWVFGGDGAARRARPRG